MNNASRFMTIVLALTFSMSALAAPQGVSSQGSLIGRFLGVTSPSLAQRRSPQFSGSLHEALRPQANPFATKGPHSASLFTNSGPQTEFPVVKASGGGFTGLTSDDSMEANGGLNGVLEPPDQGLATNGSQVLEAVNLAFRIYSNSGKPLTEAIGFNAFFGVIPPPQDPFNNLSDPRAFFDPQTKRFFLTILEYQRDPNTGAFLGSEILVAVSQTSDATGNYFIYLVDGCPTASGSSLPCLADQPLIGSNDDGFYISTNDYNSSLTGFLGARILALDKQALVNNSTASGVAYLLPNDFTVQPALPAPGANTTQNNGTEYFTESLDNGTGANMLRIFALTGTETLETVPATNLATSDFATEAYANPVPANQKAGPTPLGLQFGEPEEKLNPNDDRMQQLYNANGKLFTTLATLSPDPDASFQTTSGAWFVIKPTSTATTVSAHIVNQGYIGIDNGSVLYPAFAVNNSGDGIIGFSFSGTNYYPSTGYVRYHNGSIGSQVNTAGTGQNPEDGFTGYAAFGGNGVSRWGDYSSATVSPAGTVWFAAEYIPNDLLYPRTAFTNWGTFVFPVK